MSDFDAVLERLLTDPAFTATLAADPAGALAGYRLSPEEIELLHAQVSADAGGEHVVEQRTSKAGLFGLLSPLAGVADFGSAVADAGRGGLGGDGSGAPGGSGQGGFGGAVPGQGGMGGGGAGQGPRGVVADHGALGALGQGLADPEEMPAGYRPRVDVDGDGRWDSYLVRGRPDGGVDLVADVDGDGRVDFVGHDLDRDGIVDSSDYDTDGDGRLETRMADTDGDGWMDRQGPTPAPDAPDVTSGIRRLAGGDSGIGAAG